MTTNRAVRREPGFNVDRIDVAAGLRELKTCGYSAAETVIGHVWLVVTHGHSIRGVWTTREKAMEHARSLPQVPDVGPEVFMVKTDVRL